jgi:hypothetical protein
MILNRAPVAAVLILVQTPATTPAHHHVEKAEVMMVRGQHPALRMATPNYPLDDQVQYVDTTSPNSRISDRNQTNSPDVPRPRLQP